MKTLKDIEYFEGVKALVRVDFNVPMRNGAVADDFRIRAVLPTIEYLLSRGAKVILMSHLESIDGGNPSLEPVARHLAKLGIQVSFIKDYRSANEIIEKPSGDVGQTESEAGERDPAHAKGLGSCFLLENLRSFDGEKANDQRFARELASLADIFVNDAFSVCHREHASIVGVPGYLPSYAGLQLEKEVANLSRAFDPAHPFLFILGGAKFETKLPLLERFMGIADTVFIGGALANDFFRTKGYEVGQSLISKGDIDLSRFMSDSKLMLPIDILDGKGASRAADALTRSDKIMDAGPKTVEMLREKVGAAEFILWNGPLGVYEDGYRGATIELARMIGEVTAKRGVTSIAGGGDTLAAIATLGNQETFSFISTGGGAMLDYLAKGTLPGIEALEISRN